MSEGRANTPLPWTEQSLEAIDRPLSVGATGRGLEQQQWVYELTACIAKGGMGEVFLATARSPAGAKQVVVKRLLAELRNDEEHMEMFRYEADIMRRLNHPTIVKIEDFAEIDGAPCLVMEYVEGKSVGRILERAHEISKPVPPRISLAIILEALEALSHVHDVRLEDGTLLHLVHRDVTPGNILVAMDGVVKLTDFGIAKGKTSQVSTTVGVVKGKARYLAPEQILGRRATPRSDLFSVGCVTYEMLSGLPIFDRISVPKILQAIVNGDRPQYFETLPKDALGVSPILARALEVDPGKRFQSAKEMAAAISDVLGSMGGAAAPAEVGAFVRDLFAGSKEAWELAMELQVEAHSELEVPMRPRAVEAQNPIFAPADPRDVTVKDEPSPKRQERFATELVRERMTVTETPKGFDDDDSDTLALTETEARERMGRAPTSKPPRPEIVVADEIDQDESGSVTHELPLGLPRFVADSPPERKERPTWHLVLIFLLGTIAGAIAVRLLGF